MTTRVTYRPAISVLTWLARWLVFVVPELQLLANPKWRIAALSIYFTARRNLRLLALKTKAYVPSSADILQTLWLVSHACTVFGYVVYTSSGSCTWYMFTTYSVVSTYFLVTYRHASLLLDRRLAVSKQNKNTYVAKMVSSGNKNNDVRESPLAVLVKSENTHLLANAFLIATTHSHALKLCPMGLYSSMNLITFCVTNVLPVDDNVVSLVNYCEDGMLILAAVFDTMLCGVYFYECMGYASTTSCHAVILYCIIYGLRLDNSESTRTSFKVLLKLWHVVLEFSSITKPILNLLVKAEMFIMAIPDSNLKEEREASDSNISAANQIPNAKRVASTTTYNDTLSIIYDYD